MTILKTKNSKTKRMEKMKQSLSNNGGTRSLTLMINSELLTNFKVAVIRKETTMTEVLSRAMKDYLK